jgi:hypothetical protein
MEKNKKAFVYSLDAFVALIIIGFTISLLIGFSGATQLREQNLYQVKLLSNDVYNVYFYSYKNNLNITCDNITNIIPQKYSTSIGCIESSNTAKNDKPSEIATATDNFIIINYDKKEHKYNPDISCILKNTTSDIGNFTIKEINIKIGI